jgi:single-strand DNA-binding protein
MLHITAHGRLGKGPVERQTKSGTEMATASVAIDVTQGEGEQQTLWLGIGVFGQAEALLRHHKGDLIAIQGKATLRCWTGHDGAERVGLSVIMNNLVSAKTVPMAGVRRISRQIFSLLAGVWRERHNALYFQEPTTIDLL